MQTPLYILLQSVCLDEKRKPTNPIKYTTHTQTLEKKPNIGGNVDLDRQSGTTITKRTDAIALAFFRKNKKNIVNRNK